LKEFFQSHHKRSVFKLLVSGWGERERYQYRVTDVKGNECWRIARPGHSEHRLGNDIREQGNIIVQPDLGQSLWGYKYVELSLATTLDYVLLAIGTLASCIHGAGFSVLGIVLGGMTTVFLRAQNSEFVLGTASRDPEGLPALTKEEFDTLVRRYCLYYLGLGFAMFATSYIQIVCWETFAERITHKLRKIYLKAILRQQISWFDIQQTGNLTARLTDDLERVREGLGDKLSLFIQMMSAFVAGFCVGFAYSWSMTLVMMVVAPFIVISANWMSKIVATRTQVEQETYAVAGAIAEETFSSIRTVHSLCGHKRELTRLATGYYDVYRNADGYMAALEKGRQTGLVKYFYMGVGDLVRCKGRQTGLVKYFYMGVGVGFGQMCTYVSYALAFWYGSVLIINDPTLDRGRIFTVFFAVMSGSAALGTCLPHLNTISIARGAVRSVLSVINSRPKIDPYSLDGIVLNNMRGSIRFKNVHFSYPSRSTLQILKGVSLQVSAGQKIALVGSSGCGKSTIVNLLLRFYDPTRGKVTIDDIDVRDLNVQKLREQIGVVSQEPVLFDGTLFENIKMGYEQATMEEVQEACRVANAADFIKRLPEGYGTRVGERGVQLSGGQKQRIAIARAIIKNPRILLLDEATSALDTEAESIVQEALEKAQKGRTTVIVAHRLSTIRNVDQIFVFKNGTIVEQGTHAELMNKRGVFFEMTQAQVLRQEKEEEVLDSDAESDVVSPELALPHLSSLRSRKESTRSAISAVPSVRSMQIEMEDLRAKPTPMSKIFYFNRDKWGYFILGLIACIITGTVTPTFAVLYAQIIQVYSEPVDQMRGHVLFWCGAFIVIGLIHAFAFFFSAICLGRCGEALTKKLRFEAFKNLLRQDVGFYDDIRHGTGKLCTRFATDAPNVRYVFTRLPGVLSSAVTIIGALVIGFIFGWQLALILMVMVPLIIGSGYFEMRMQFGKKMRDTELLEEAGKVASQAVENIRTVHALNRQEQFHFMYCEYLKEPYRENLCQAHTYGGVFAFSQSLLFFMYAVAFWIGAIFVDNHNMQPIDVYRVFFAFMFCGQMVGNISSFIPDVVKARLAASLLFYLIEHPSEIDNLSEDGVKKVRQHLFFAILTFSKTKVSR
uniref:ABC transmembrane type-1 domain-containing protein n=1 Tax=Haemonchus placei TaxID=6290 RepID=A0A0N4WT08_HAEPC